MTLREPLSTSDRPEERDRSRSVPPELAETDRLIADLAALVDAGLVVVHEHVLGPVRYGAAAPHDARPDRRSARPARTSRSPSCSGEHRIHRLPHALR